MSAPAWVRRVTVSPPTNVPAPGLKRTVRESDWTSGEDPRLDEPASRPSSSTARRAPGVHVVLMLDIRAIQSQGECRAGSDTGARIGPTCDRPLRPTAGRDRRAVIAPVAFVIQLRRDLHTSFVNRR